MTVMTGLTEGTATAPAAAPRNAQIGSPWTEPTASHHRVNKTAMPDAQHRHVGMRAAAEPAFGEPQVAARGATNSRHPFPRGLPAHPPSWGPSLTSWATLSHSRQFQQPSPT